MNSIFLFKWRKDPEPKIHRGLQNPHPSCETQSSVAAREGRRKNA